MFGVLLCAKLVGIIAYMIYMKVKELQIKMKKLETNSQTDIRDILAWCHERYDVTAKNRIENKPIDEPLSE